MKKDIRTGLENDIKITRTTLYKSAYVIETPSVDMFKKKRGRSHTFFLINVVENHCSFFKVWKDISFSQISVKVSGNKFNQS